MKTIQLFASIALLLMAFTMQAQSKNELNKVTFYVNLHCHSCVKLMMKNLPYEKGVKDVHVDLDKKEITILFRDDKNNVKQLQEAIEKLGYTAQEKKKKPEVVDKKEDTTPGIE